MGQHYLETCSKTLLGSFEEMGIIYLIDPLMLVLSGVNCRRPGFISGQHKNSPNWLLPIGSLQQFEHHIVHDQ
jgi:hypothetical protein